MEFPPAILTKLDSWESFKFDFSVDDSVSFRSVTNESVNDSIKSESIIEDYEKLVRAMTTQELRQKLKAFNEHMPPLHNEKLIDNFRVN